MYVPKKALMGPFTQIEMANGPCIVLGNCGGMKGGWFDKCCIMR